jgi:hypothetical protein
MSPRAAWLVEALAFTDVSHYLGGISDWSAAALPIEDISRRKQRSVHSRVAASRRASSVIPSSGILQRMGREAYAACFVLNDEGVLLGRIYRSWLRVRLGYRRSGSTLAGGVALAEAPARACRAASARSGLPSVRAVSRRDD